MPEFALPSARITHLCGQNSWVQEIRTAICIMGCATLGEASYEAVVVKLDCGGYCLGL